MTGTSRAYARAVEMIDAAHAADPSGAEQAHADAAIGWLARLDPSAGEIPLLAARAHHLRRWEQPRADYPGDHGGYVAWRTAQLARHALDLAAILGAAGYSAADGERAAQIVRKERLWTDPVVQAHEDAVCLTFMQLDLPRLVDRLGAEKVTAIMRKVVAKMSDAGVREALVLDLDPECRALVEAASRGRRVALPDRAR